MRQRRELDCHDDEASLLFSFIIRHRRSSLARWHYSPIGLRILESQTPKLVLGRLVINSSDMECPYCGKIIAGRKGQLNRHIRQRHSHEKPFSCTRCPKAFKNQYELNKHNASHGDERPFPCPVCGKAFKLSSTLATHKRFARFCAQALLPVSAEDSAVSEHSAGGDFDDASEQDTGVSSVDGMALPTAHMGNEITEDPFLPSYHGFSGITY